MSSVRGFNTGTSVGISVGAYMWSSYVYYCNCLYVYIQEGSLRSTHFIISPVIALARLEGGIRAEAVSPIFFIYREKIGLWF